MSDKRISDSSILASDSYESHGPWKARLNSNQGCWVFRAALNFLQVDLGERLVLVSGVATQGCFDEVNREYGYVLEYQISFSDDGVEWYYYQEDKKTKVFLSFCFEVFIPSHINSQAADVCNVSSAKGRTNRDKLELVLLGDRVDPKTVRSIARSMHG